MLDERFFEFAVEARERYLSHYRASILHHQREYPHAVAEVLLELGGDSSELLRKLMRVDLIWGGAADPHVVEVNHDPVDTDTPLFVTSRQPTIEVYQLVWNACEVAWPAAVRLGPDFTAWYERWMDLADHQEPAQDGLSGVVHSVTSPDEGENGWGFSVDLGSAPVQALVDLLELPSILAAGSARLGSFSYK